MQQALAWIIWRPSTEPAAVCNRNSPAGTARTSATIPYTLGQQGGEDGVHVRVRPRKQARRCGAGSGHSPCTHGLDTHTRLARSRDRVDPELAGGFVA